MKKILMLLLVLLSCQCLHAEKQFNYRGIFPADRKSDAAITNYILLKKDNLVEFALEEQGKGTTDRVKISEIKLTSNAEVFFPVDGTDLSRVKIDETGIYQVTLVPSATGGGEIRFVLIVKEKSRGDEPEPVKASLATVPANIPVVPVASAPIMPVSAGPAVEKKTQSQPAAGFSINQVSIGKIETVEDFARPSQPAQPDQTQVAIASQVLQVATSVSSAPASVSSAPTSLNASETPSLQDSRLVVATGSVKLLAPAEGFYLNPLNGFVFNLPAGQSEEELRSVIKVSLMLSSGQAQPVAGQFFSARPGQITFLPDEIIPGAVYSITDPAGEISRRAAFPQIYADCDFLADKIVFRLNWAQIENLLPNPLGQKIRLENSLISIMADAQPILSIDPDQVAPYGVAGDFSYFFRPYEMVFTRTRPATAEEKQFDILVSARIDGEEARIPLFKQSFSKEFKDVAAQPASVLPDEVVVTEIPELSDLPEDARYMLLQSFPAYENESEANKAWPEEVCWSDSGILWLIDSQLRRVCNFSDAGKLKLAFGSKGDNPGQMGFPVALTLKQGRVYIADTASHCLHKFAEDGSFVLHIKSDPERGVVIDVPGSLCFRGDELWVIDRSLAKVSCFDVDGKHLGGFGDSSLFNRPISLRSDDEGLLILEKTGIIKKFTSMGQQIFGFQTGCPEPRGFDVDPWGTIWVCDAKQLQVIRFNQKGRILSIIKAPPGPKPWMPTGVAMRKDGLLAVSDAENKKIHLFSPENNY